MSQKGQVSCFAKGLLSGMLAGMVVALVGKSVVCNSRNLSKGSSKMVRAVGDFVDGIQTMIR